MKIKIFFSIILFALLSNGCKKEENKSKENYLDFSKRDDQYTGGIKMIPIKTPKGEFKVWTKRIGNNPTIKVLLLHGGPGLTHELYESFEGYFPNESIEFIYYDQLGSYYSDQPKDKSLWTNERFVEEVEQVRIALGLNKDNFYILGQSWGGILAMDYALKYQKNIKGLIISNMMSSIPEYNKYAQEVLGPKMNPKIYAEIMQLEKNKDFANPRYTELLFEHYYTEHILRKPQKDWPESITRCFKHINSEVYISMQGFSEFGITGDAYIKNWDVSKKLKELIIPTLTIGSKHDTMDPKHMEWMATQVQNGRFLFCPNGSHLSQYDDQKTYFDGVIKFLKVVDNNKFNK
jgi:proline iminopeptidase